MMGMVPDTLCRTGNGWGSGREWDFQQSGLRKYFEPPDRSSTALGSLQFRSVFHRAMKAVPDRPSIDYRTGGNLALQDPAIP
jgi:hypothetical protein